MAKYRIATLFCCLSVLMPLFLATVGVAAGKQRYDRSVVPYTIPDVTLLNQDRVEIKIKEILNSDKPVLLDFIYGTCTTICPVLSAGFSNMQKKLGANVDKVRFVSVSIDPEYDTPEAVARYLRGTRDHKPKKVLQVFRNDFNGRYLAEGFQKTWELLGQSAPDNKVIEPDKKITGEFWKQLVDGYHADVILLWLNPEDLATIEALADVTGGPQAVFVSSSQLKSELSSLPESMRDRTFITYPYELPQDGVREKLALKSWLKIKNIPLTDLELQGKLFCLGRMLTAALMDMRRDFYRERFFEGIDMMIDWDYTVPIYPTLSFGPAQRYASKGCYITKLTKGPDPQLEAVSNWVNH